MKKVGQSSTAFDVMMQTMRQVCPVLDDDGNGGPRIEVLFAASLGRIRLHGKKANLKGTFQKALNKIWPKLLTQRGLKVELPPATQQQPQSLSDDEEETSAIHLPLAVAIVLRITLQYTLYDTAHKTCSGKTVMTDALSKARLEQWMKKAPFAVEEFFPAHESLMGCTNWLSTTAENAAQIPMIQVKDQKARSVLEANPYLRVWNLVPSRTLHQYHFVLKLVLIVLIAEKGGTAKPGDSNSDDFEDDGGLKDCATRKWDLVKMATATVDICGQPFFTDDEAAVFEMRTHNQLRAIEIAYKALYYITRPTFQGPLNKDLCKARKKAAASASISNDSEPGRTANEPTDSHQDSIRRMLELVQARTPFVLCNLIRPDYTKPMTMDDWAETEKFKKLVSTTETFFANSNGEADNEHALQIVEALRDSLPPKLAVSFMQPLVQAVQAHPIGDEPPEKTKRKRPQSMPPPQPPKRPKRTGAGCKAAGGSHR
jgi:hypothetical protein